MEMSFDYLRETVDFFAARGFEVETEEIDHDREGQRVHTTVRHLLRRGPDECFGLSCVRYPGGEDSYWLEIRRFHGLRTFDTELDSWKHRENSVEFKYYPRADGVGLSFILELSPD